MAFLEIIALLEEKAKVIIYMIMWADNLGKIHSHKCSNTAMQVYYLVHMMEQEFHPEGNAFSKTIFNWPSFLYGRVV